MKTQQASGVFAYNSNCEWLMIIFFFYGIFLFNTGYCDGPRHGQHHHHDEWQDCGR